MVKPILPSVVAHPNLANTSSEGLKGAYDLVVLNHEKFITTKNTLGSAKVFTRVSSDQVLKDKSDNLKHFALEAKSRIRDAILKLRVPPEKKERLLDLMAAQIKGNIKESSKEFIGADAFNTVNQSGFRIPVQKQVRFVIADAAEIPRNDRRSQLLPKEVILPEIPPDE
jgi:hypothetical protein